MRNCKRNIPLTEKEWTDLSYMAYVQDLSEEEFARQQLSIDGIERLSKSELLDVSQGCVRCRARVRCQRCRKFRNLGGRAKTCFDCSRRAANPCSAEAHAAFKALNAVGGYCGLCGADLGSNEQVPAPHRVPDRDGGSMQSVTATRDHPGSVAPEVRERRPFRRAPLVTIDYRGDCDSESRVEYSVTIHLDRKQAHALASMARCQGVTLEAFLRIQLGMHRFNRDRAPDWMRADASQGCVLCASITRCDTCEAEPRLIGGGAKVCFICVAGPHSCGYEVHSRFAAINSKPVESGKLRQCELCERVFELREDDELPSDANGPTDVLPPERDNSAKVSDERRGSEAA